MSKFKSKFTAHPGKQTEFLATTIDNVFFGGARGPGKSFGLAWKGALQPRRWSYYDHKGTVLTKQEAHLLKVAGKPVSIEIEKVSIDYPEYIGILIRRNSPMLERNLKPECDKLYRLYGGEWKARSNCYLFPSGAKIYLVHCLDEQALWNFIGGNYHWIGVDEANQFPEDWIDKLRTCLRSTNPELVPQMCLASNPGEIGHIWLKRKFVDKCKPTDIGEPVYSKEFDVYYQPKKTAPPHIDNEGISWQFIPATVFDNPSILLNYPKYVRILKNLNPTLRAMWLEGDWDVFAGMYFDMWNPTHHTIPVDEFVWKKDFDLDTHALYRFYDYGTKAPFVCAFAAVGKDGAGNGKITIFDEIVETGLSASRQAKLVNNYTLKTYGLKDAHFSDNIADPAYWTKGGEKDGLLYSPKDFYLDAGINLRAGNNDRKAGAKMVYDALTLPEEPDKNGNFIPFLRFRENCTYSIETFPLLPASKLNPEDVDTKAEDHSYDAIRYGCTQVLHMPSATLEKVKGWRYDLEHHNLPSLKPGQDNNLWKAV